MLSLLKKLSLLERLAFALSVLYGIGVILLLEHSSLYIGFEKIDFLRLKPILVGLQFVIYLFVPFVVFILPAILVSRTKWPWWGKALTVFIGILFLMVCVAVMLHYFIPYTYRKDLTKDAWYYPLVVRNFWLMYFYWDGHIIALSLFSASVMLFMKHIQNFIVNHVRWMKQVRYVRYIAVMLLGSGMFMAMFFFDRDVYMNISQSAGGGAPIAGIITIANPGQFLKSSNVYYAQDEEELSKPCFLVQEDSEFVYISEMFEFSDKITYLRNTSISSSICRIPKQNVIQFAPISYYQMWNKYLAEKIAGELEFDVLQHVNMYFGIQMQSVRPVDPLTAQSEALFSTTNTPILTMWIDGDGVDKISANSLSIVPDKGTNLLVKMVFGPFKCQKGRQVVQWHNLLTNSLNQIGFKIDNLPGLPSGYQWGCSFAMGVECNYLSSFDIMQEYQPQYLREDGKLSLMIRKKAFCKDTSSRVEGKGNKLP